MHRLFPDHIPESDPSGFDTWNYDWAVENTGAKWFPEVEIMGRHDRFPTVLRYDTAWSPNNKTLERLHKLTGWSITNAYEGEGHEFEGRFTCDEDDVADLDLPVRPRCDDCETKTDMDLLNEFGEARLCPHCYDARIDVERSNTPDGERCEVCRESFEDVEPSSKDPGVCDYCYTCGVRYDVRPESDDAPNTEPITSPTATTNPANPFPNLFTDEQYQRLLGNGDKALTFPPLSDPKPVVKLFTPDGAATWLLSEISRTDTDTAFGLCDLGM